MDSLRTYRVGIAIAILLLLVCGWLLVEPHGPDAPPFVSTSAKPDGLKAWTTLLQEKGNRVKEWKQPMRALPRGEGQALVMVEPLTLTGSEQEELFAWVKEGNDLIVFEDEPEGWESFQFSTTEWEDDENTQEKNIKGQQLVDGQYGIARTSYRINSSSALEVLLYDDRGILAGRIQAGEGSVMLFLVPEWLTNQTILKHNHFEAIWPYFQKKWSVLWMDEYHHGMQQNPGLLAVYPGWLIAGCMQAGILLLLWIWWKGKRFGPVYTLREWTVRRGDETLLAVSSWYERRSLAKDALLHREAFLRQLLFDHWGVHRRADRAEIIRLARTKWSSPDVEKLANLLERIEWAKAEKRYTSKQLLKDSLLIDDITMRLEKE
ncbi:DUF4350 domain-containing protein [Brevibacillus choshinensis]|uniref:DUF4350 domain-containing protein n=1 Tax=Brevibacillus choshinensis TaxID=54911 RepID=A0ABX7FIU8_BRECH|nr:DUF4350 domain-containing protein [Brevibacillus choshinensis]QRG65607.1 DUF4350 domain-containing protein [Brevibacillus choshinensis]